MSQFNLSRTEQQHFLCGFVVYDLWLVLCLSGVIFFQRGKEISFVRNTESIHNERGQYQDHLFVSLNSPIISKPKGKLSEFFENDNRVGNISMLTIYTKIQGTKALSVKRIIPHKVKALISLQHWRSSLFFATVKPIVYFTFMGYMRITPAENKSKPLFTLYLLEILWNPKSNVLKAHDVVLMLYQRHSPTFAFLKTEKWTLILLKVFRLLTTVAPSIYHILTPGSDAYQCRVNLLYVLSFKLRGLTYTW